uniref:Cysteine-rich, acidic integral membrane protein-like isoform X1 n=1 Tax=Crassostrea virginica TaxID=6565 RepID=A0A8B8APK7_CRAVI|nr:cysteine-rich, acidic integral membrane protein-like isoform X1 [Crassostrea virginica]
MAVFTGIILALILGVFQAVSSQSCDDVDETVCQIFRDKRDICEDQCLSKLCPRTCGNCPLRCYKCDSVSDVNDCNATSECSPKEKCIVTESLGADFTKSYRMGCASSDVCTQLFGANPIPTSGTFSVIGKRLHEKRANLDGDCCDTDLCNKHTPTPARERRQDVNVTTTMMPTGNTMMPEPTESADKNCSDIDTAGCQRLASLNKAMCSDPCVVQACPRTCGKCSECYWCNHVKNPEQCNQTTQCNAGEKCYVLETLSYSGDHSYNVGCMHQDVCNQFHTQAAHIFGKRADPVELSLDGDCCSGDLCNHHAIAHSTATTTAAPTDMCAYTAANHHCPMNFHLVDGKCYMIGESALSFNDALSYCSTHCSHLAENLSHGDYTALSHWVTENFVYIGAKDQRRDGEFTWITSGRHAGSYSYPGALFGFHNSKTCASFSERRAALHAEDCSNTLKPLCQARMK